MLSDFLFVRNLTYRGSGGEGQKLPFSVFAVPGYTGVIYEEEGIKMFKVSDDIPTFTENDCGCFVAFNDTTMANTYVVPFIYDDNGEPLNGDTASLQLMPGLGIIIDPKEDIPCMMWADDAMYADIGLPEPGTYVHKTAVFMHWALMWGPKVIEVP